MKILGIDPGSTRTGYGIIDANRGLGLVSCGLISGEGVVPEQRPVHLEKKVSKLLKKHRPNLVCLEKLFFTKNIKTASVVSEARGIIILAVRKAGYNLLEFTPSESKSMVAGDGRSDKRAVKRAVMLSLGLDDVPGPDDVADALAVAIRGSFELTRLRS